MSDAKIKPDGWVSMYWRDNRAKDIGVVVNCQFCPDDIPVVLLPTSELEEVVKYLVWYRDDIRTELGRHYTDAVACVLESLNNLISRLSTGRMDGGGEE